MLHTCAERAHLEGCNLLLQGGSIKVGIVSLRCCVHFLKYLQGCQYHEVVDMFPLSVRSLSADESTSLTSSANFPCNSCLRRRLRSRNRLMIPSRCCDAMGTAPCLSSGRTSSDDAP